MDQNQNSRSTPSAIIYICIVPESTITAAHSHTVIGCTCFGVHNSCVHLLCVTNDFSDPTINEYNVFKNTDFNITCTRDGPITWVYPIYYWISENNVRTILIAARRGHLFYVSLPPCSSGICSKKGRLIRVCLTRVIT